MRVVLIGANGQLGSDLAAVLSDPAGGFDLRRLTHADLELCDHGATRRTLGELRPAVVVNTAAYHRVDECEGNPARAFEVNALAAHNLAETCRDLDAALVHLSTDYVFGGDQRRPYVESDRPNPVNVYGVSKLAGEHLVRNTCPRHFIVRTSGLYGPAGSSGKGGNFVELMLRLAREGRDIKVVDDQVLTPTYTPQLARKIAQLIGTERYGLYHITNHGQCTWYEFAEAIFRLAGLRPNLAPTTTEAFGARARRPGYSVLENAALAAIGLDDLPTWREALAAYAQAKAAPAPIPA